MVHDDEVDDKRTQEDKIADLVRTMSYDVRQRNYFIVSDVWFPFDWPISCDPIKLLSTCMNVCTPGVRIWCMSMWRIQIDLRVYVEIGLCQFTWMISPSHWPIPRGNLYVFIAFRTVDAKNIDKWKVQKASEDFVRDYLCIWDHFAACSSFVEYAFVASQETSCIIDCKGNWKLLM